MRFELEDSVFEPGLGGYGTVLQPALDGHPGHVQQGPGVGLIAWAAQLLVLVFGQAEAKHAVHPVVKRQNACFRGRAGAADCIV